MPQILLTVLQSSRKRRCWIRWRCVLGLHGKGGDGGGSQSGIRRQTSIESQSWCCLIVESYPLGLPRGDWVLRVPAADGVSPLDGGGWQRGRRPRLALILFRRMLFLVDVLGTRLSRPHVPGWCMAISYGPSLRFKYLYLFIF